ncbi:MFS general substrate transporter [Penicillium sp. IBT 16267x]|nr:MFS general substrate transporter [Penicillium sp. IBT 16267x]
MADTMEKADASHLESTQPTADEIDTSGAKEIQQELQSSHQGGYIPISAEEKAQHRALNRKLDLYLVPFCALIYLFNGLDRSNLGNAQTNGFTADLGMPATAINTATSLFFATYVPCQPLSAALGKKVGQSYWLGIMGVGWGILTLAHAWVKTEPQLIAIRLLIGVFEAGFYPTVVTYMSLFYPRYDLAFRIALFYGSYAIAGAFGGIIAYGCFKIKGAFYGWQYLFIIEGVCSLAVAIVTPFWLAKSPGTAWFLKPSERAYAENRMIIDSAANQDSTRKMSRRDIVEGVCDWKLWLVLPFNILSSIPPQGFTIFFPLVVKGLGYSGPTANLMTVPPYVIGAVLLLCFAFSSDHFRNRLYHILGALIIVMIGLILTVTLPLENVGGRYAGLVILLAGTFIASPLTAAWLAGNTPEPGKRTVVIGINGWGNLAGIIGSELFLAKYGPTYHYPLVLTLVLVAVAFVGYVAYRFALKAANIHKAKKVAQMTPEEIEEESSNDVRWADRKYTFVYGL